MSRGQSSDDNINLNQIKTNPTLQRAQSDMRPIKRSYFYNDSQMEDENSTNMEEDTSILKMMTSPLRQLPSQPMNDENNEVSTPKKNNSDDGAAQDNLVSSTQETDSGNKTGTIDDLNKVNNNSNVNMYAGRMYNRHTPDLNRIIKYRKSNNSPGKNLLERFRAEQESESSDSSSEENEITSNTVTSVTNIGDKTNSDINVNVSTSMIENKPSSMSINKVANATEDEVTNSSYNPIDDNVSSSPNIKNSPTGKNTPNNDINNFKENLRKQLENPSDEPDTPPSQRSVNILQSSNGERISPTLKRNKRTSFHDGNSLSEKKDNRAAQNKEVDYSYHKGEIIYSFEPKADDSEKDKEEQADHSETRSNGTIIFDSQSNKHTISNHMFETQGNGSILFDSQSNRNIISSNTADKNDMIDTQSIPSTLTFSADAKYNELLESQKNTALDNENKKLEYTQPISCEETQPTKNTQNHTNQNFETLVLAYKNIPNNANMETQPIKYIKVPDTSNGETQPIIDNKTIDNSNLETQLITLPHTRPNDDDFKLFLSEPQVEATVLNEVDNFSTHVQTSNLNQSEVINHSDFTNPRTEDVQVPRTSSPEKKSSPSKHALDFFVPEELNDTFKNSRVTVTLDVPRVPDYQYNDDNNNINEPHGEIIESDLDESQDLPEMDEDSGYISTRSETEPIYPNFFEKAFRPHMNTSQLDNEQTNSAADFISQNSELDDSQNIIVGRRNTKRKVDTLDLSDQEELAIDRDKTPSDQSSPHSKLVKHEHNNGVHIDQYPTDYRASDPDNLTKDDIHFKNAVWCVYDKDLRHYPGILLSVDEESDTCLVLFNTERYTGRMEDISYLDIRIGDIVQDENNILYKVCGLQCLKEDAQIIRCIRGYDTVVLEKAGHGNKEKHIVRALADIRITIECWAERNKIEEPFFDHLDASLQVIKEHTTRRQTRTQTASPRKGSRGAKFNYAESDSGKDSFKSELEYTNKLLIKLSKQVGNTNNKLFSNCIFVLTGVSPLEKGLIKSIKAGGGRVLKSDFLELFDFEKLEKSDEPLKKYTLDLKLKSQIENKKYEFGCILSESHSRSVKYLQTLALGWPTLHWNFIEACVRSNSVLPHLVHEYLLPSGVSFKLGPMYDDEKGPVLSNEIFTFYSNYIQGNLLKEQVGIRSNILNGYTIIFCGSLDLDNLLRFYFAALGVSQLIQTPNINDFLETDENILEEFLKQDDASKNKLIIFINEKEKVINKLIKDTKKQLRKRFKGTQVEYHVEEKEWLIQTIINRNHSFDQYFYRNT